MQSLHNSLTVDSGKEDGENALITEALLNFVDLAGSEKLANIACEESNSSL